jgi:hypothetical protein
MGVVAVIGLTIGYVSSVFAPAVKTTQPVVTSPAGPGPATAPIARPTSIAVASGPAPKLVLAGVIGTDPFWTAGEILQVARSHHDEMIVCAREGRAAQPTLNGSSDITVSPKKDGTVGDVSCNVRGPTHDSPGEAAICGCTSATMGRWRFPPAHGRLGLLDSGPFIFEYRLF